MLNNNPPATIPSDLSQDITVEYVCSQIPIMDALLPKLNSEDLKNLATTSRFFKDIANIELKKRRIQQLVAVEDNFAMALINGEVFWWGLNEQGQFGNFEDIEYTPIKISIDETVKVKEIITNENGYIFFILENDDLWRCGRTYVPQAGEKNWVCVIDELRLVANGIKKVISDGLSTVYLKDQEVLVYGDNQCGQLGLGHRNYQLEPLTLSLCQISRAVLAYNAFIFLSEDGKAWGCGSNEYGQLGLDSIDFQLCPAQIQIPSQALIKDIVVLSTNTIFLLDNGEVWGCGNNKEGQLGLGHKEAQLTPVKIPIKSPVKKVIAESGYGNRGGYVVCLLEDGTVWSWGQCGYSKFKPAVTLLNPTEIAIKDTALKDTALKDTALKDVVDIIMANNNTFYLTEKGEVWSCGRNMKGELGSSAIVPFCPDKVLIDGKVKEVITGKQNTFFITSTGEVWGCGNNAYGELGVGHKNFQQFPVKIPIVGKVIKVEPGPEYTFFRTRNDEIWSCGSNSFGQLGLGHNGLQLTVSRLDMKFLEDKPVREPSLKKKKL